MVHSFPKDLLTPSLGWHWGPGEHCPAQSSGLPITQSNIALTYDPKTISHFTPFSPPSNHYVIVTFFLYVLGLECLPSYPIPNEI